MKTMTRKLLAAFAVALPLSFSSCGEAHTVNEQVATAETAMAEQNYEAGRRICDGLLGEQDKNVISAAEYARLSILYMQFYENADDSEALEMAVECYRKARELDADSAMAVYATLPADEHKYAYALSMIVSGMDNPGDSALDNDRYVAPDSIGVIE